MREWRRRAGAWRALVWARSRRKVAASLAADPQHVETIPENARLIMTFICVNLQWTTYSQTIYAANPRGLSLFWVVVLEL